MPKKQKLELTWIGKDEQPRLEPRILIEDSEKSYFKPTPSLTRDLRTTPGPSLTKEGSRKKTKNKPEQNEPALFDIGDDS